MNITPKRMSSPRRIVSSVSGYLYDILRELSLTANLDLVLDAADKRSYDGTSQTWTDVTGQGNNFFLGLDGTATATDPTFAGKAGVANEGTYFSFDGGDYFTETAGHIFAENWHKNNGAFSIVMVPYYVSNAAAQGLWDNGAMSFLGGTGLQFSAASNLELMHATAPVITQTLGAATNNSWNYVGVSADEANITTTYQINGTAGTTGFTASTDVAASPQPYRLCAEGEAPITQMLANGSRFMCVAMWSTNIGAVALNNIYKQLRARRLPSLP